MRTVIAVFLFVICYNCYSQTTVKYYKDEYLTKEVSESKAKYTLTTTRLEDGRTMIEVKDIENNRVLRLEDNKGEPFGKWYHSVKGKDDTLDYDFKLDYKDSLCQSEIFIEGIKDFFADNDSAGYEAPKLSDDVLRGDPQGNYGLLNFMFRNLIYPAYARENAYTGTVYIGFMVTKTGAVEKISVKKGVHRSLDKEAMRVIKKIKFKSGAKYHGEYINICFVLPVVFRLG